MAKYKVDISNLIDEELVDLYNRKNIEKTMTSVGGMVISAASGFGIVHKPVVFVPAAVAFIALNGIVMYKKENNLKKIESELKSRGLYTRLLYSRLKKSKKEKTFERYEKLFHEAKLIRIGCMNEYETAKKSLEFLLNSKYVVVNPSLYASKAIEYILIIDDMGQKIKTLDKELEDLKFLLDGKIDSESLMIPSEVMPFSSFEISKEKIKIANELFSYKKKIVDEDVEEDVDEKN